MNEQDYPAQLDPIVQSLPPEAQAFFLDAYGIWQAGGWAMIAIAAIALIMFAVGMNTYFKLLNKRFELSWRSALITAMLLSTGFAFASTLAHRKTDPAFGTTLSSDVINMGLLALGIGLAAALIRMAVSYLWVRGCGDWPKWLHDPKRRRGPIGELLKFVTGCGTVKETAVAFEELRATEIKPFSRELLVLRVCVASAPLLGLLGTVTGMIATFDGLTQGSGGEKTKGMVASGISEALITTETGLVIALAGLFFQYQLARKHQRYNAFLAHMETVCTQRVYKRIQQQQAADDTPERKAA